MSNLKHPKLLKKSALQQIFENRAEKPRAMYTTPTKKTYKRSNCQPILEDSDILNEYPVVINNDLILINRDIIPSIVELLALSHVEDGKYTSKDKIIEVYYLYKDNPLNKYARKKFIGYFDGNRIGDIFATQYVFIDDVLSVQSPEIGQIPKLIMKITKYKLNQIIYHSIAQQNDQQLSCDISTTEYDAYRRIYKAIDYFGENNNIVYYIMCFTPQFHSDSQACVSTLWL